VIDPIFWLGLSILLVAVSLTAVLVVAIPAFKELARAARSAEKLFDTLSREFPPTLEAIRLTSLEISELTDDVSEGVQNAGQVAEQVNKGVSGVTTQAKQAGVATRSMFVGVKTAWKTFNRSGDRPEIESSPSPREQAQLQASETSSVDFSAGDRRSDSAGLSASDSPTHTQDDSLGTYLQPQEDPTAPESSSQSTQASNLRALPEEERLR
jgi:uncharacterized protein YoxC